MAALFPALTMFGGLLLRGADGVVAEVSGRKTQRLLAMIALGPPRGICRETLTETLWPEFEPEAGRKAMATALWRLKSSLNAAGLAAWLVTEGGRVSLSAAARDRADAVVFERTVAEAHRAEGAERGLAVARAEALCTGEFMAGDADEWCLGRRAYYAALRTDLNLIGLRSARDQGDWAEVVRRGQALAESEPLLEEAHQEVMRAHLLLGNRPAALATYRALERALARELSLKPADDSRRLRLAALPPRFSERSPAASPPSSLSARLRRIASEIEELERRAGVIASENG